MADINNMLDEFKIYLTHKDLSDNSVRNYLADIKQFLSWYEELDNELKIKRINFYHINAYREYIIHTKRLKTASVNRAIQALKNFFQFLNEKKLIKENPAAKIKFARRLKPTKPRSLNKQEVHALLSVTSHSSHGTKKRNYAIVQLFLQTGVRVSELLKLEIRDLDLYQRSGQIRIVDGKGCKERIIPLNSSARKALTNYFEESNSRAPKDLVFLSKRDKMLTARAVQKLVGNLAKKANIQRIKVTPHILRHTFANNYLRANPECLLELSTLLGHESLDTTAVYTIASEERLLNTVEKAGIYINE